MKNSFLIITYILVLLYSVLAETNGTITYVEGWVDLKSGSGSPVEAFIGDDIVTGDTIITGSDGSAIIEKEDALTINIAPDTVFTLQEVEGDDGKETAMATTVGSVKFKFNKLIGREPKIRTPSMVAGVRGTEFTVWTAPEGSTLVAVTSGEVAVSAEGATVSLLADEGVAIEPGKVPGEKFSLKGRPLNHADWANKKMEDFLKDPMTTLNGLEQRLKGYYKEIELLVAFREAQESVLTAKREELKKIKDEQGKEKSQEFYTSEVLPLESKMGRSHLNIKYWSLSAYNLKRQALSKTYLVMKTKYLKDPDIDVYTEFMNEYDRILSEFWDTIGPYLAPNDV